MHAAPAERSDSHPAPGLPWRIHLLAWGALLALGLVLFGISRHYQDRNIWRDWTEARGFRNSNYAERVYADHVFRTKANTWSNLAYVLVGFYVLALGAYDRRRGARQSGGFVADTPAMSFLFGLACCYLGFGSGLFHASLTRWGQQIDVASMYAPLLAGIALHLGRWLGESRSRRGLPAMSSWPVLTGIVVVTSFLLYRYKWSMSANLVLTTLIVITALGGVLDRIFSRRPLPFRWLGWSTAALVAAVTCRQLDVAGKFSGPDSWLQGHAFWHVLTAASLACLYAYHRSETPTIASSHGAPK